MYTVKEVAELANVTVKTLHYYHKVGLLLPSDVSEAGYRLYGMKELERLQQILFYRELDFSLKDIQELLNHQSERAAVLAHQKELLLVRKQRLERLIDTIGKSIDHTRSGKEMDKTEMFQGFQSEEQWTEALAEQNEYLKKNYGHDLLQDNPIDVKVMNKQAMEAQRFMQSMANALQTGIKYDDESIRELITNHMNFLTQYGHTKTAKEFAKQARFFLEDDFHRQMLESQQTGLAYYLCTAAESLAAQ